MALTTTIRRAASTGARALRRCVPAKAIAVTTVIAGGCCIATGAALIYVPAGFIVGGLELAAAGLLAVDVDRRPPRG